MDYKFFTKEEADYIYEMYKKRNPILKNNFEEIFFDLHYDELIKGREGERMINNLKRRQYYSNKELIKVKIDALNCAIKSLPYNFSSDIIFRITTLNEFLQFGICNQKDNYIKLLTYIIMSENPKKIYDIETLESFIDELSTIIVPINIKKYYLYYLNNKEEEEQKIAEKEMVNNLINTIIEKNKKYELNKYTRDIFSEILEKKEIEGEIIYLNPESEIEIFNIWEKAIIRRVRFYTILNKEIKTYCTEKHLDYIMALYSIYIKNQYHYYCTYTNHKAYYDLDIKKSYFGRNYLMNFIRNRIKDKYIGEINSIPDIEDNIVNMFNTLDNNMDNQDGYFDITTAMEQNFKAFHCICIDSIVKFNSYTLLLENEIKKEIEKKDNIDNISNTTEQRETITKEESIKELTSVTNTKEEKRQFSTIYTYEELKEIFRKSIDKGLFETNTRLEDFLYVCGGYDKPQDFKKLNWIKKAKKSKVVNKKMMIYFFMKIFNLNCGNVLAPFINYINDNVIAGEKPVVIGGKPCLTYDPEELKGFFL